ncbi:MAG: hypothetical protein NWF01_09590 [Candidatus Bathyarchaeota archaeon]|nr:hypothetical protein [Candidatus Bathyarchaeota archaeon]
MKCKKCDNLIGKKEYDKYFGLCKKCVNDNPEFLLAKYQTKIRIFKQVFSSPAPLVVYNDDMTPRFICNLPKMVTITDPSEENFALKIVLNNAVFEREGNTVGFAGFLFDSKFHWATTPENMIHAWNWFNKTLNVDDDFWRNIAIDTIRDTLDNSWNTYENEMNDTFIVDILYLIWALYNLDKLGIDTKEKFSEIRMHCKGRTRTFEKLSKKSQFSYDFRFSREACQRITDIRKTFAHMASEAKLAALSKGYGFDVELSNNPDIKINGRWVQVKKPIEHYITPQNLHGIVTITNETTEIEKLAGLIKDGFRQNADIVAIEVNHLDDRIIDGYKAVWGKEMKLANALTLALGYTTKSIVLVFKETEKGWRGRIVKCKKIIN